MHRHRARTPSTTKLRMVLRPMTVKTVVGTLAADMTDISMNTDDGFPASFLEAYAPDVINGWCLLWDYGSDIPPVSVGFVTLGRKNHAGIPFVFNKKKHSGYFGSSLNGVIHGANVPSFVISPYLSALERPPENIAGLMEGFRRDPYVGDHLLVLDWGKPKKYEVLSSDILAFGVCSVGLDTNIGMPFFFRHYWTARDLHSALKHAYYDLPISDRKWGYPRGKWKIISPTTQLLWG